MIGVWVTLYTSINCVRKVAISNWYLDTGPPEVVLIHYPQNHIKKGKNL